MKNNYLFGILAIAIISTLTNLNAQCANSSNIYSFNYNSKTYQVIKENKSWADAATCAVSLGGYLAEINDAAEQTEIFTQLTTNAGITNSSTVAGDGGGGSYVWIGGNDISTEGTWIWDGDNTGTFTQFWSGDENGSVVASAYTKWGDDNTGQTEPDNFQNNQDGLGISLNGWPLGDAGEWNDVNSSNTLYYIVEFNMILNTSNFETFSATLSPNPSNNFIEITSNQEISRISILNTLGQIIKLNSNNNNGKFTLNVEQLPKGIYFARIYNNQNKYFSKKFIKN